MKRTTISPSRLGHFPVMVCLVLGAIAIPSHARTGLAAQQPAAAPAAPQTAGPLPATHTVQQGETLWGLAKQLMGDPLLWPEIYRLNTTVIEDPHWIFPGEELRLVGTAEPVTAAAPAAPAPAPSEMAVTPSAAATPAGQGDIAVAPAAADTEAPAAQAGPGVNPATGPTIFGQQGRARVASGSLQLREQHAYRAVREGEYYSSGFLLEPGDTLNAGHLIGNTATSSISRLTTTNSAMLYGTVAVSPPAGDSLKPGDVLLSFDTAWVTPSHGVVIQPTGLLKVTKVGQPGDNVMAQVIAVYQTINGGQGVMKAVPYHASSGVRPEAVETGLVGEVIALRTPHEVLNEQDVLFIDKGLDDGVRLGDIFQVSRTSPTQAGIGPIQQKQALLLIVYGRAHTATGVIIQLDRPDIRPGSTVRQIRRMPS